MFHHRINIINLFNFFIFNVYELKFLKSEHYDYCNQTHLFCVKIKLFYKI